MIGSIKKVGTLLATLALFASLLVSIPVAADMGTDVYAKTVTVGNAAPTIGENITLTADIQAWDLDCVGVKATFEAVNGTTILGLGQNDTIATVTKAAAVTVEWYWDSTVVVPDPALVYDIRVTLELTGDTNETTNTTS